MFVDADEFEADFVAEQADIVDSDDACVELDFCGLMADIEFDFVADRADDSSFAEDAHAGVGDIHDLAEGRRQAQGLESLVFSAFAHVVAIGQTGA